MSMFARAALMVWCEGTKESAVGRVASFKWGSILGTVAEEEMREMEGYRDSPIASLEVCGSCETVIARCFVELTRLLTEKVVPGDTPEERYGSSQEGFKLKCCSTKFRINVKSSSCRRRENVWRRSVAIRVASVMNSLVQLV